ncbi:PQQ-dependent sugar dehydrogenase [Salinigranum salinum]|uniref:PQQ-dependent sugar dehydrogenase n=1 Tax=Salinigranum salinum TaxID=1364937 RepID=UPI001260F77E|nr:PQQ-dependent sugar dehydrogenase [Salinigranum salinum]
MDFVPSRRRFLQTLAAGAAAGLAGCSQSVEPPAQESTDGTASSATGAATTTATSTPTTETSRAGSGTPPGAVAFDTLARGLGAPLDVVFAPDTDRRYIADQAGRILVHDADGLRDRPALDLGDAVVTGGERGLLGIELHPEFAENRRLFVRYSAPPRSETPDEYSHTFVLSEFRATDDGSRVDPDSERTLLEIPQPQSNHNAGDLAFGPDGYLYVAVGDGGGGGDQGPGHVDDWYDAVDGGNGQDTTENLLGSILRLDVDETGDDPYAVPDDNPLVGREGLDEQYAWGFRNPWRMSFDGTDLFVGDVGQSAYEEVSLVEKGGNYGWNVREGTHCFRASDCPTTVSEGDERLVDPIVEYPHGGAPVSGISVIGGAVYRGSAFPDARGVYVFGDYRLQGRLFAATRPDGDGLWPTTTIDLADGSAEKLRQLRSFGRDADGELYVVGTGSEGGALHRLVPAE